MTTNTIYQFTKYNMARDRVPKRESSNARKLAKICERKDRSYHLMIDPKEPCIAFGDIDHCPSPEVFSDFCAVLAEGYEVDVEAISYTECKKSDADWSYHWSIPSTKTDVATLKAALGGASCFDGYSKYIDLSIYCSHPFRLPNQTNFEKPLKHVIKRGEMIDFFVHYTENATVECEPVEDHSDPEDWVATVPGKDWAKNESRIRDMVTAMPGFFDSYDRWFRLGMIIHHESGGAGRALFDELSRLFKGYSSSSVSSKWNQIDRSSKSSAEERKRQLTIGSLCLWHREVNPVEAKEAQPLTAEPSIVGCERYLSNLFTKQHYTSNRLVVLQSCCGSGKTYAVSKYVGEEGDKVISLVHRRSLVSQHVADFRKHGTRVQDYRDQGYDAEESGVVCINSLCKFYGDGGERDFKDMVVYIDEVNSLIETLTHSITLRQNVKRINETLMCMLKHCKKIVVSDHVIRDTVFDLLKGKPFFVKNTYQNFRGVKALQLKDEVKFKDAMQLEVESGKGFFAGFDSATTAADYFHHFKPMAQQECLLVTAESTVEIPENLSVWEGKCVFYSPKVECGCDFSVDTKQKVFYHMKGHSVLPSSAFQQICRTRNMKSLTWYSLAGEHEPLYEDVESCESSLQENRKAVQLYSCSTYLDSEDEVQFSKNSFYKMYVKNEYTMDCLSTNKELHLLRMLEECGMKCSAEGEYKKTLPKEMRREMRSRTAGAVVEEFDGWLRGDMNRNFSKRAEFLKLRTNEEKKKYERFICDEKAKDEHRAVIRLLKTDKYIQKKRREKLESSYTDVGVTNSYSKIQVLSQLEKAVGAERFGFLGQDTNDKGRATFTDGVVAIDDTLYGMIRALFHKRNKVEKPATYREFNRLYASLLKNICPRLVTTERVGKKKERIYGVDKDMIRESVELDLLKNSKRTAYDEQTAEKLGIEIPERKEEPEGPLFLEEEEDHLSPLDRGLTVYGDESDDEEHDIDYGFGNYSLLSPDLRTPLRQVPVT